MGNTIISIKSILHGMGEILKPSDRPVMGERRLVRHLPVLGKTLHPAIWVSPYTVIERVETNGSEVPVVKCVVLLSKGPPRPDVAVITVRPEDLVKFPMRPVEW